MSKHIRIAVADGDAENRRYYQRILPQMGYTFVGSASTTEGLRDLVCSGSPSLVIVDEMLPGLGGVTGADGLAHIVAVPLLLVSSNDSFQDELRERRCDDIPCLVRPFKPVDLEAAIDTVHRPSSA